MKERKMKNRREEIVESQKYFKKYKSKFSEADSEYEKFFVFVLFQIWLVAMSSQLFITIALVKLNIRN